MNKPIFAFGTVAKAALIWLTLALVFASAYGALLSSRPAPPALFVDSAQMDAASSDRDELTQWAGAD
ncbi:hypothetical protein [Maricaulis sp. CAU 1757]